VTFDELARVSRSVEELARPLVAFSERFGAALTELAQSDEYRTLRRARTLREALERNAAEAAARAESETARAGRSRLLELVRELPERLGPVLPFATKHRAPLVAGWSSHAPPSPVFFTYGGMPA